VSVEPLSLGSTPGRIDRGRFMSALEALEALQAEGELDVDGRATARRLAHLMLELSKRVDLPRVTRAASDLDPALRGGGDFRSELRELCRSVRRITSEWVSLEGETILVVEDDLDMQEVLTESLDSPRWEVICASNIAEAKLWLQERIVSLVVLDLRLPDGDGRDVLELIRQVPGTSTVPVVVTSGLGGLPVAESLALGADAYLSKPFDPGLFRATVGRLLTLHAERSKESRTDGLTGLPNRRALSEAFLRARAQASRSGESFTLAILDLNSFKAINDTHGHLIGDQVLIWFARIMRGALRTGDYLARWGGDEFVVLLRGSESLGGLAVLKRCLEALDENPFVTRRGIPLRACFSAGVVESRPGQSLEEALAEADRGLYRMKATGVFARPRKRIREEPA
jgi:two-component system, cell cycle response regulator